MTVQDALDAYEQARRETEQAAAAKRQAQTEAVATLAEIRTRLDQ